MDNIHPKMSSEIMPSSSHVNRPKAPSRTPTEIDQLLLKHNAFSHSLFCPSRQAIVLDVGPHSAVFPNHFASYGKTVHVIVVEPNCDQIAFNGFNPEQHRSHAEYANLRHLVSMDEALDEIRNLCHGKNQYIDFVKFSRRAFNREWLKKLTESFKIGHLCGELAEHQISKLDLYRMSASVSDSFAWRDSTNADYMSGFGGHDIEVSIVVPVFNVERYLPQCLESLVKQTIKRKEIILVDDGSTDSSGRISEEWAEKHPEIRVIHQANAGCATARSKGLANAAGKFVGFVDSDDWVEADMFEKLFEAAVTNNAEVAQCGFQKIYELDNVIEPVDDNYRFKETHDGCHVLNDIKDAMYSMPSIWRRIYNTEFLRGKGIDFEHSLPRFDDLPFQFEVFMHARKMAAVPDIYYNYRLGRVGQDVSATDERLFVHFDIFKYLRKKVALFPLVEWERHLKRIEIATHEWALTLIEKHLKRKYMLKAAKDIIKERLMISRTMILLDAFRLSKTKGLLILAALLVSPFIRKK